MARLLHDGALEGERVADLNVESSFAFIPFVIANELFEKRGGVLVAEQINVLAEECALDEKLQGRGTEDGDLQSRLRRKTARKFVKPLPGFPVPVELFGQKFHKVPD